MKLLQKMGAALAMVVVLGALSCDGSNSPGGIFVGVVPGPSAAEFAEDFATTCALADVDCDGVIAPVVMSAGEKGLPATHDDDLWALVYALLDDMFASEELGQVATLIGELRMETVPDTLEPGQVVTFGPVYGTMSLSEACAPGTGSVTLTLSETYSGGTEAAAGTGKGTPAPPTSSTAFLVLTLLNCRVEGEIDDVAGNDVVVITGSYVGDSVFKDNLLIDGFQGSFTINPGLSEPAGDPPAPIWGFNETIAVDMEQSFTLGDPDRSGGICYGGSTVTEVGCEGIFLSYQDFIDSERPFPP